MTSLEARLQLNAILNAGELAIAEAQLNGQKVEVLMVEQVHRTSGEKAVSPVAILVNQSIFDSLGEPEGAVDVFTVRESQ